MNLYFLFLRILLFLEYRQKTKDLRNEPFVRNLVYLHYKMLYLVNSFCFYPKRNIEQTILKTNTFLYINQYFP